MHRTPLPCRLATAIALALPFAAAADGPRVLHVDAAPLPRCLEQIAAGTGARFIVSPRLAQDAPRCRPVDGATSAAMALDAALVDSDVAWHMRDDGVFLLAASAPVAAGTLDTLAVEDTPLHGIEDAAAARPLGFRPAFDDLASRTTYDAAALANLPLRRFSQLGRYAPNVYSGGYRLSIRGVPRDSDFYLGNSVFVDGIDVGSTLLPNNLLPVDALENLEYRRSGTSLAYGSGAAGGAVLLATRAPAAEPTLQLSAGAGERSARSASAGYSGPVLEALGLSASISVRSDEEPRFMRFADQFGSPFRPRGDSDQRDSARLVVELAPDAWAGFTARLDAFHVEGDAPDRTVASPSQGAPFDPFDRVSFDSTARDWDIDADGVGLRLRQEWGAVALDAWGSWIDVGLDDVLRDDGLVRYTWLEPEERHRAGAAIAWSPAAEWTLRAGFERQHADVRRETEELSNLAAQGAPPNRVVQTSRLELDTDSVILEAAWTGERWRASAGARRADERSRFTYTDRRLFPPAPEQIDEQRRDEADSDKWLPAIAVAFDAADGHELSATWSRGFRSGGFAQVPGIGAYAPERLDTTEIGWKATFGQGGITSRATLFRTDWRDRTVVDNFLFDEQVEPLETRIDGLEWEFEGAFGEAWRWRAGIGLMDARHTQGILSSRDGLIDLGGRDAPDAPRSTLLAGLQWRGGHGWSAGVDAYRASSARSQILEDDDLPGFRAASERPAYTVVDAQVRWTRGPWDVALVAANVFDEEYADRIERFTPYAAVLGEPRQVDLTVTWTW
jgi:outer membrane receptor protein involved in Fe transport